MSVITISRGTYSGGNELAVRLAGKLGYKCISREELSDRATALGVPVGKLQMAMVKPPRVYLRMGRERDQYLSCMTMLLCEKILEGDVVYYGHTGHLLLPGIPNILRIRVLADMEFRIKSVSDRLKLDREKAKRYIKNVDADRDKWVKFLYGVDWHDPLYYDLVINLDQTGIDNAATAFCAMAELPDFKLSPAAVKAIRNLYLGSKAHFALTTDPRTSFADIKVVANEGNVQVNYLPQQSEVAPYVYDVLSGLEGIKDIHATVARTSILYLQEEFSPETPHFPSIANISKKWDATVELMKMVDTAGSSENRVSESNIVEQQVINRPAPKEYNGGIEDDEAEEKTIDAGTAKFLDRLQAAGCSGSSSIFYGKPETLSQALRQRTNYSMIIIGELFSGKPEGSRKRLKAEMKSMLSDALQLPVVEADELQEQFKFGTKQVFKLVAALIIAVLIFAGIFTYQRQLISLLTGEQYRSYRILAVLLVVILTPVFAYTYGTFARQTLRFFRLD
jgi:cytidylate kinase